MYKIILVVALVACSSVRGQAVVGNPFSPDDDMMTTFQKTKTPSSEPAASTAVIAVPKKEAVVVKKETARVVVVPEIKEVTTITPVQQEVAPQVTSPEVDYILTGLPIYSEGRIVGLKFASTTRDKKYILFKTVSPNRALPGRRDTEGVYLGAYLVPTTWWNNNVVENSPTWDQLNYIKLNFRIN